MKLLNVVHNSRVDTGGKISHDLLMKELEERGHQIEFLSTTHHDHFETHLMEDHMSVNLLEKRQKLVKEEVETQLEKGDYNYVYGNGYYAIPGMLKAAEKFDIKTITHYRDYWFADVNGTFVGDDGKYYETCNLANIVKHNSLKRLPWNLYKWRYLKSIWSLLTDSDNSIATSNRVKRELADCGIYSEVLPNPVDVEKYYEADSRIFSQNYELEKPIVTFIGSLNISKGTKVLEKLIQSLEETSFIIAGSGEEREELETKFRERDNVVFTGWIERKGVRSLVNFSDIILYPSIVPEGFGRVAVEAMAGGSVAISSDRGGLNDIIKDGENGYLLQPNDFEEWKNKLAIIIEESQLREDMGKKAKKDSKQYSVKNHAENFLQMIDEK